MYFDWKRFCNTHGVQYITKGPNTAHNHISIHCPFCGSADTSEHMGLSLDRKRPAWGCWRSRAHRGVSPVRLIVALLGCSEKHAKALVDQGSLPELDQFNKLFSKPEAESEEKDLEGLTLPKTFRAFGTNNYSKRFEAYLEGRGFPDPLDVAQQYDLRYCLTGTYANRVILPIYYRDMLVGWTGRDTTGHATLRYNTLTDDTEVARRQGFEPAPINIKSLVLWQDYVELGGEGLLIVEGPLDALKVDYFNQQPGVVVTCLFGKPTAPQLRTLSIAARKFGWVASALDPDAWADALPFISELQDLSGKRVISAKIEGAEDPGAMNEGQVQALVSQCQQLKTYRVPRFLRQK